LFRAEFDPAPKALSRLVRCEGVRQQLVGAVRSGSPVDLARLAHECGCSGHPHLVADFRQ